MTPTAPPRIDLPPRPRLGRPAWRRGPDAVQFGTGAERALVLDGLTPPLVRMLTALDGTRSTARVLADAVAAGVAPDAARAVLRDLHSAGLLAAADTVSPAVRARGVVVVHGASRIGVALACLLAAAGVGRVRVAAAGPVRARDTGTGLRDGDVGRPAVQAAAEAVVRAGGAPAGDARTARRATARPDLVVLAAGRHPDPVVAAELVAAGRAHLVVGVDDDDTLGVIGPLVVPGRTPCLRCDDLARADVDPAWPRVAAELAGSRPEVPVATAAAVAAVAADHVLALLDAGSVDLPPRARPASLGAVLLLDPRAASWRRVAREPHPGCGCGAPATVPAVTPPPVAVVVPAGVEVGGAA